MRKYIIVLAFLPTLLFGQNNADSLKFEIIKGSINFLSTDKKVFPEAKSKKTDCIYSDYDCLTTFCAKYKMVGASDKIAEWGDIECKTKEDLSKLTNKIIADLTTPKTKEYRLKMEGYSAYQNNLIKLVEKFKEEVKPVDLPKEQAKVEDPPAKIKPRKVNEIIENPPSEESSILPFFALLIGIISLAISGYTLFKLKSILASKDDSNLVLEMDKIKTDVKDQYSKLVQKLSSEYIKPLEDKVNNIDNRLMQLEHPPLPVETFVPRQKVNKPIIDPYQISQLLFAKLPDLGNGFSQSILLQGQNGEQIYEIKIKGEKASFSISDDTNAQKYALSDFNYYLSNACDFLNQPVKNCSINTIEKGTLTKTSGNWIIQTKAKIEFK